MPRVTSLGFPPLCVRSRQEIDRNMANTAMFLEHGLMKVRPIFVKDHVETPMQVVFNRLNATEHGSKVS